MILAEPLSSLVKNCEGGFIMRKNLHYKVLASVLAIAGLYFYNAPAAWAEIKIPFRVFG